MKTRNWKSRSGRDYGRRLHSAKQGRNIRRTLMAGVVLATGLGGLGVVGESLARNREQTAPTPRLSTAIIDPQPLPQARIARQIAARPAPAALQAELDALAEAFGEPVGIAVHDIDGGWTAQVNGDQLFPQQSVSKTWVALAVLDAVDRGQMKLDDEVVLTEADRSVFNQPIAHSIDEDGFTTTVRDLLKRAITQSDNAANDVLLRRVGGAAAVSELLARKRLAGLRIGAEERDLQARIAGLTWRPEYGDAWQFNHARSSLAPEAREAALAAYLDNPMDGATPVAIAHALAALKRGEVLSEGSSDLLLTTLGQVRTGPRRLKGGLPEGWAIAHKTGTGQDYKGSSIGINDVALITAPDGHTYAVAVLIRRTNQPNPDRLAFMQDVTRAVVANWARSQPRTS